MVYEPDLKKLSFTAVFMNSMDSCKTFEFEATDTDDVIMIMEIFGHVSRDGQCDRWNILINYRGTIDAND